MRCKHKQKHTELYRGKMATIHGFITVTGDYSSFETPVVKSQIVTYCADCGIKLKQVVLTDK